MRSFRLLMLCFLTVAAVERPKNIPPSWKADDTPSDASAAEALAALGEKSLQCSACDLISAKLFDSLDSKLVKAFKVWDGATRLAKVTAAFEKACGSIEGLQLAMAGNEGARRFGHMEEFLKGGGDMGTLEVKPKKFAGAVQKVCGAFVRSYTPDVVGVLSKRNKRKKRLLGINLKGELCETYVKKGERGPVCAVTGHQPPFGRLAEIGAEPS